MRRRDWLAAILGAPFVASLPGCDDEAPPSREAISGELVGPSMEVGHLLHDEAARRAFASGEAESRQVKVAILGGGPSGLSAAWRLAARGERDFGVYELEDEVGGTAIAGASEVTRYPFGAHYLPMPKASDEALLELLEEMGAIEGRDEAGEPIGQEHLLVRAPEERLFYRGFWYPGVYPRVGASAHDLAQLERFERIVSRWVGRRDGQGRRAFDLPLSSSSDDAAFTDLDAIDGAEWCRRQGLTSSRLLFWLDYGTRDDYGLRLSETSAWALLFYHAARLERPDDEARDYLTWPEGNGAIVEHLASAARGRLHGGHLVVAVRQDESRVEVDLIRARDRRPIRLRAERAIVAMPRFVRSRIVEGDAPADDVSYGPWMVANLHLAERPAERGSPPAWDNVLFDSPSLGYVSATHQRGRDFGPTVWSYYLPLTGTDARRERERLLEPSLAQWRDAVLEDLARAHPNLDACVRRIEVCRWGHAMAQPRPGFFRSEARRAAARPRGRLAFAHSDLSGLALFEEAFDHGLRAADETLAALREPSDPT